MRWFLSFQILSLASTFAQAATGDALNSVPENFPTRLKVRASDYRIYKHKTHCQDPGPGGEEGGNGPTEVQTALDILKPAVVASDIWTNKNYALMERVVYKSGTSESLLSVQQEGCDHVGYTYKIVTSEKFDFKNIGDSVKKAVALLREAQSKGILVANSLNMGGEDSLKMGLDKFIVNKAQTIKVISGNKSETRQEPLCKAKDGQPGVFCGAYEDPNNYDMDLSPLPDGRTSIAFTYYYVL
jgi:hypothetical protein